MTFDMNPYKVSHVKLVNIKNKLFGMVADKFIVFVLASCWHENACEFY